MLEVSGLSKSFTSGLISKTRIKAVDISYAYLNPKIRYENKI